MLEADIGSVTLALQTLGSFNFGGKQSVLHSPTHSLIPHAPIPQERGLASGCRHTVQELATD